MIFFIYQNFTIQTLHLLIPFSTNSFNRIRSVKFQTNPILFSLDHHLKAYLQNVERLADEPRHESRASSGECVLRLRQADAGPLPHAQHLAPTSAKMPQNSHSTLISLHTTRQLKTPGSAVLATLVNPQAFVFLRTEANKNVPKRAVNAIDTYNAIIISSVTNLNTKTLKVSSFFLYIFTHVFATRQAQQRGARDMRHEKPLTGNLFRKK